MRRVGKSSPHSRKETVPKEMIHVWSLGETSDITNPYESEHCKTSTGPNSTPVHLDNSSLAVAVHMEAENAHRDSSKHSLMHPQSGDMLSTAANCMHASFGDILQAVATPADKLVPETQSISSNGLALTNELHTTWNFSVDREIFSSAHSADPTELMGIGTGICMNQPAVSNFALSSSENQLQQSSSREHCGVNAYAREPSATSFPAVRNADETFGGRFTLSNEGGSASNTIDSPSTGRRYRYRVAYDSLFSEWYVCDCESATFERIGWVDTSEVWRQAL